MYIKGVTGRFGFDVLELRNFKLLVKNKATGTPYGVYYISSLAFGGLCQGQRRISVYLHLRGAFGRCSFRQEGVCEDLNTWNG